MEGDIITLQDLFVFEKRGSDAEGKVRDASRPPASGRSSTKSCWRRAFPESLEFVARSMRAGHAFSVSIEMIHREFQEPLAGEFRRTFDEHNLGLPLDRRYSS
jgi:hypothetical protein